MSDGSRPEPTARRFLEAVTWGEHRVVWGLLSRTGREAVMEVGVAAGLDPVVARRLLLGELDPESEDDLLGGVVRGLRVDLDDLEVERLTVLETDLIDDTSALVDVVTRGFHPEQFWSVGQFQMVRLGGEWFVEGLRPHRTLS